MKVVAKKQPKLHDVVTAADIGALRQFLSTPANKTTTSLDGFNEKGQTALYLAARDDRLAVLRILLEAGASINLPSQDGYNPLHIAASEGHVGIVKALLSYPTVDVNARSKNGWTALMQASNFHHQQVVKLLLALPHLEVNAVSQTGCSALYFAASSGDVAIVKLLLGSKADPAIQSKSGYSPLHISAEHGYESIIQDLLLHDVHLVNLRDQQGRTAQDVARTPEIKRLLYRRLVKTMSEDVLQFNPKLLDNIPNVMPSISESIQDPSTENIIQTNDTQQSVEQSHHQIQGSNETILRANEALLALSAADPLAIQHLLQSNDLQLHQQARIHYIQTHPFLQIYYLTFVKYLSSCVIALQALHSEFIQDTRSSQPEDVMAMLDSLATYSGFAGVGLVTYVGMYLCSLHGDAERKYTIDQVMHVFPTISSHRFIDLLAQDLTIENEKEIHALAREAKNSSLNKPNIILRWINKAEGLLTWIQEGFSSVTGGYLVGGNGNSSTANELIESFALVHAGKVLDGIFRYRKHSCHESHQKQILHRLNIYPLEENKLWILKCLALDLDILTYHPNNDQDSTGDSSPAVDPTANSPSKRRPLPPIPPPRTSSALSEKSNLEFGKQEAQHLDEMLQKVNQLQDQLNKQNEANVPERNIYSEVDELHRQLSQLTKKLQQLQEQDSSEQDVDQDIDVGNGYGQKKMQRNTMSKASSQASSNKSSSHTTEGAQTSTALLEQVVIELTLQVRLLQEDVSQLSQTPSRESLPLHYVNTPPIKPKRENTPHPRIDDGDNVKSAHGQLESSNSEHAACCIIM